MNVAVEPRKHLLHPVVILGAAGDVGRRLALHLSKVWPGRVVLAGRNISPLKLVAAECGQPAEVRIVDASQAEDATTIPNDSFVISLTEASTPAFIQTCLDRGITYIDSSASQAYTQTLKKIGRQSRGRGRLVLFAGFMPGLTNALADAMVLGSPGISKLEVIIQFGLGRHHGAAATEWTFKAIGSPYHAWQNGAPVRVKSGSLLKVYRYRGKGFIHFASGLGSNDQIVSGERNRLRHCHTYMAFDSAFGTGLLAVMLKIGFGPVISRYARGITSTLNRLPTFGSVGTRLSLFGYAANGELLSKWELAGGDQADITSLMLAETALSAQIVSTSHVTIASELVNAKSALGALARAGLLDAMTSSIEDVGKPDAANLVSN